jgi:hypothetical protein
MNSSDLIIRALTIALKKEKDIDRTNLSQTNSIFNKICNNPSSDNDKPDFNDIDTVAKHYNITNILDINEHILTIKNHQVLNYIGQLLLTYQNIIVTHTSALKNCTINIIVQCCTTNNYQSPNIIHCLVSLLRNHYDYTDHSVKVIFQHCLNLKHYHLASLFVVGYDFVREYWLDSIVNSTTDSNIVNKIREIQFFDNYGFISYGEVFRDLWNKSVAKSISNFLISQMNDIVMHQMVSGQIREFDFKCQNLMNEIEYFTNAHLFSPCKLFTMLKEKNVMTRQLEEYFTFHISKQIMQIIVSKFD